jgi:hypothetical protein
MKISGFLINKQEGYEAFSVNKNNNNEIVLETENDNGKMTFTFNNDIFEANSKKLLFTSGKGKFVLVDDKDINRSRDYLSYVEYEKMINDIRYPLAHIYFADNLNNSSVIFTTPIKTSLSENEYLEHTNGVDISKYLAEQYPSQANYFNNREYKKQLLGKINTIDSVVSIEQQLDLLTEIVKSLVNNEEQPSWSGSFLTDTLANASQTARPVEEIKTDIVNFKSDLRAKVGEYLIKKS